jgi:hypothetical protein
MPSRILHAELQGPANRVVVGARVAVVLPTVAVALRLDPLAVSASIEDRRPVVRHAVVTPAIILPAILPEVDLRSWLSEPHERLWDGQSRRDAVPLELREELLAQEAGFPGAAR